MGWGMLTVQVDDVMTASSHTQSSGLTLVSKKLKIFNSALFFKINNIAFY